MATKLTSGPACRMQLITSCHHDATPCRVAICHSCPPAIHRQAGFYRCRTRQPAADMSVDCRTLLPTAAIAQCISGHCIPPRCVLKLCHNGMTYDSPQQLYVYAHTCTFSMPSSGPLNATSISIPRHSRFTRHRRPADSGAPCEHLPQRVSSCTLTTRRTSCQSARGLPSWVAYHKHAHL